MTNNLPPQGPEGGYGSQEPGLNSSGSMPQYPSSPSYGQSGSSYGQGGPGPSYSYDAPGVALVNGDGQTKGIKSISKSFGLFAGSAGAWVGATFVAGLVLLIVALILGVIVGVLGGTYVGSDGEIIQKTWAEILQNVAVAVLTSFGMVYGLNGALQAVEGRPLTFKKFFALKHACAPAWITAFIVAIASSIPNIVTSIFAPAASGFGSIGQAAALISIVIGGIAGLVLVFVMPLFMLAPAYSVDLGLPVGESLARCLADSKRNYLSIFGTTLLMGLIVAVSALPLLLGLLVTVPMSVIVQALLYRQQSGGQHVVLD